MADLKISDLVEVGSAKKGDKLIINTDNNTTHSIDAEDLLGGALGGGTYYTPQFHWFQTDIPRTCYPQWSDIPGITSNPGQILEDVFTSETIPVEMPEGSDAALIFYFFFDTWNLNDQVPNTDSPVAWRQYTNHGLEASGPANPTYETGGTDNTMGCIVTHNVTMTASDSTKIDPNRRSNFPQVKFNQLNFTPSQTGSTTINFKVNVDLLKAGWNCWSTNFGRITVLPFKKGTSNFGNAFNSDGDQSTIFYSTGGKSQALAQLFPELSPKEAYADTNDEIMTELQTELSELTAHIYGYENNNIVDPGGKLAACKSVAKDIQEYIISKAPGRSESQVRGDVAPLMTAARAAINYDFEFYTNASSVRP